MDDLNQNPLMQRLESSSSLPTLPHILLRIMEVCDQEDTQFRELSQLIDKDPALSSKILSLVNSTRYGLPNKVRSIEQALPLIGMEAVKNAAICASIHQVFAKMEGGALFNLKSFWKHSLTCAGLAKLIAQRIRYPNPEEAFLAGLIHDLGKLVLWVNLPREYAALLRRIKEQPGGLLLEEAKLGATHSEVGGWLIRKWNLNSLLADAVSFHHEPLHRMVQSFPLVKIVYAANALCSSQELPAGERMRVLDALFGLSQEETDSLSGQAEMLVGDTAKALGIEINGREEAERMGKQDHQAQETLSQAVKDLSLVLGALQGLSQATGENELIRVLYQGMDILLGLKRVVFFRYDGKRDLLVMKGFSDNHTVSSAEDLVLPVAQSASLLAESLLQNKPCNSFNPAPGSSPSLLDEQIKHFLKQEGIFCLPLSAYKKRIGVLVIGLPRGELQGLLKKEKLVSLLAHQSALALYGEELRQNQLQTIQAERWASTATMTQKVVHEVNNPLAIIKNYLKILDQKLRQEQMAMEEIRIINEEIERVSGLLGQLSQFSAPKAQRYEFIDLNALIADLAAISREPLSVFSGIQVHLDLDPALPKTASQKDNLKQILINLMKNAAEAAGREGNITISTRYLQAPLPQGFPALKEILPKGDLIEIKVQDDGPGIPETMRLKLFEPFTSTKGEGHQGLGLAIVYSLVKELRGTIACQSSRESGTCFAVTLPLEV